MKVHVSVAFLALALCAAPAGAVTKLIGDVDGFGLAPTAGLVRATGSPHTTPADTDGDGFLEPGEFLPDLNKNGSVAVGSGDDFDNRSAPEIAATDGSQNTDHSLTPTGASNGALFKFTFPVPEPGDIDYGVDHFINFVFGDYDVVPATLDIDGVVIPLTTQGGSLDGLVQSAYAVVPWSAMTDGTVTIKIIAPNEPYLAFDYALLDTDQIADQDADGAPDPIDNCPGTANQDQADADADGVGDACDACYDLDQDGACEPGDNCPFLPNPYQADADGDGAGDACDVCALDPDNDADLDGVCGNEDNCPANSNPGQANADNDAAGDACDGCTDADADTVCDNVDICAGTAEFAPTVQLGTNRFADANGDGVFETVSPKGQGPGRNYTMTDTGGCSCSQIVIALGLGEGHMKFGCSISAMDTWMTMVSQP